ncbi:hypothetical protein evm_014106 [Chilo suppressalis]|nr:hypothetical protein evm_014106 [Chilo suppressalis]
MKTSVDDRSRSGCPRSVRTPAVIKAVKARIQRNPKRKQKLLALQMRLSITTGFGHIEEKQDIVLNARLMDVRLKRCRALLKWYAGKNTGKFFFRMKKFLTVEESYSKQNDKVYAHSSEEASNHVPRVQRGHFPSSLMVWHWVFQQDSASAHRAKSTQDWLAARDIDFIRYED